tara:strand:- start:465 stop:770 length:306 start_codon:yes stop_codon:yes gene_type:complete
MHFYGGGYIKETTGSWIQSFKLINDANDKWIIGYRELSGWSVNRYIRNTHTHELNDMLKLFPATFPQDKAEISWARCWARYFIKYILNIKINFCIHYRYVK